MIVDIADTSISPPITNHKIFAVALDSHLIHISLGEGDSTEIAYYVNEQYDTLSLKFLDHSSREFVRASD